MDEVFNVGKTLLLDGKPLSLVTSAGFALHLTTAIARPAVRNESSARRTIAQPASKDVNQLTAPVVAG
jgi:hypothetical protein